MILFDLKCSQDHGFEAWFPSNNAYDAQVATGSITCPVCGDAGVTKAPMAPRIGRSRAVAARETADKQAQAMAEQLRELRRAVEAQCDYVGDRFAEEARRIHYGETDPRAIYGEANAREAAELAEEGISVNRIPWIPQTNS